MAGVYDATARTMTVYLNGQVDNGTLQGTVTSSQQDSPTGVLIGQRFDSLSAFGGRIDDVRIYSKALTAAEVQTDMATGVLGGGPGDTTPPTVSVTAPAPGATVSGIVNVTATAADDTGVAGVSFLVDGAADGRRGHRRSVRPCMGHAGVSERRAHAHGPSPRCCREFHSLARRDP